MQKEVRSFLVDNNIKLGAVLETKVKAVKKDKISTAIAPSW